MSKPTDRDLVDPIARVRAGEMAAFGELVRRHQQRIHRLAVHMLRDRAEAERVTQETFVRAFQALARLDGRSEASSWFCRITINLSLNRIRSQKGSHVTPDSEDPRLDAIRAAKTLETSNAARSARRRELYLVLCQGIDQLSETLRTTLILVSIDGWSHTEASSILGAPQGTIAWCFDEAHRKLKEFLHDQGFDHERDWDVSETRKKLSLDAALREWPSLDEPQENSMDWEEMARRIDERVLSGDVGVSVDSVSNENLVAPSLGQVDGERHNFASEAGLGNTVESRGNKGRTMTMPVDRVRDRQSLKDLAKMAGANGAMTPPPAGLSHPIVAPHSSAPSGVQRAAESKKDDSGIVDLAMASKADPGAIVRARSTPLATEGLFDDEPASIRPPPVSTSAGAMTSGAVAQQPVPSMPPFSADTAPLSAPLSLAHAPASVPSSAQMPVADEKKRRGLVTALVFGGLLAASAVAAGRFFFVQNRNVETAAAARTETKPVVAAIAVAPPEVERAEASQLRAPAPEATVDLNALPDGKVAPKVAFKGAPAPVAAPIAKAPVAASPEEATKLSAKDLPTSPTGPDSDLGSAMGKAVGADGKPVGVTPAAGNAGPQFAAGTVPQKPSQGAVTGALGAVMSGARACLGPDDPISRATITFASAGTVQSVNVSGGAVGKPAEECIKAALGKAKLTPFVEPTYTANITVRH